METPYSSVQEAKLEWSQPKLVELDVNQTESASLSSPVEGPWSHPFS
ncbi:MAG: hypothetical protein V2A75_03300 [Pseudomonadota bacterium]